MADAMDGAGCSQWQYRKARSSRRITSRSAAGSESKRELVTLELFDRPEKRTRIPEPDPLPIPNPIAFGSASFGGRRGETEDAVSLRPGFFALPGGPILHFFAVFDGHGGPHVAALCRELMHALLAEELRLIGAGQMELHVAPAVIACFERMDALAVASCACGQQPSIPRCGCPRSGFESAAAGSTATVVVVGPDQYLVASCGDSRAALSRGGTVIQLTTDHKPNNLDEVARIEKAGGHVVYQYGARVNGMLDVSRAIGNSYLKPAVISKPEIRIVERHPQDECLIVASDGLWDVMPTVLACSTARNFLGSHRTEPPAAAVRGHPDEHPRCSQAADLLARAALARNSADDISVIVIDFKSG